METSVPVSVIFKREFQNAGLLHIHLKRSVSVFILQYFLSFKKQSSKNQGITWPWSACASQSSKESTIYYRKSSVCI